MIFLLLFLLLSYIFSTDIDIIFNSLTIFIVLIKIIEKLLLLFNSSVFCSMTMITTTIAIIITFIAMIMRFITFIIIIIISIIIITTFFLFIEFTIIIEYKCFC